MRSPLRTIKKLFRRAKEAVKRKRKSKWHDSSRSIPFPIQKNLASSFTTGSMVTAEEGDLADALSDVQDGQGRDVREIDHIIYNKDFNGGVYSLDEELMLNWLDRISISAEDTFIEREVSRDTEFGQEIYDEVEGYSWDMYTESEDSSQPSVYDEDEEERWADLEALERELERDMQDENREVEREVHNDDRELVERQSRNEIEEEFWEIYWSTYGESEAEERDVQGDLDAVNNSLEKQKIARYGKRGLDASEVDLLDRSRFKIPPVDYQSNDEEMERMPRDVHTPLEQDRETRRTSSSLIETISNRWTEANLNLRLRLSNRSWNARVT